VAGSIERQRYALNEDISQKQQLKVDQFLLYMSKHQQKINKGKSGEMNLPN